jgi:hypothetical protein
MTGLISSCSALTFAQSVYCFHLTSQLHNVSSVPFRYENTSPRSASTPKYNVVTGIHGLQRFNPALLLTGFPLLSFLLQKVFIHKQLLESLIVVFRFKTSLRFGFDCSRNRTALLFMARTFCFRQSVSLDGTNNLFNEYIFSCFHPHEIHSTGRWFPAEIPGK